MGAFSQWGPIFRPPPSAFVTAMTAITFTSLARAGVSEIKGTHLKYSKFFKSEKSDQLVVSIRTGMLIAYMPAFLAGAASFGFLSADDGVRALLVASCLTLHFLKRILEVLFLHKYSGGMAIDSNIVISLSYCISTATMIYCQHLTRALAEPYIDLKYAGIVIFLIGVAGNFYHHYLLSKLRGGGDKEYKIPRGGFFKLVVCPHYLFEILGFVGISCIAQTLYATSFTLGTTAYLMGRSYVTRKWYLSKFEDFPKDVKALIPYVF